MYTFLKNEKFYLKMDGSTTGTQFRELSPPKISGNILTKYVYKIWPLGNKLSQYVHKLSQFGHAREHIRMNGQNTKTYHVKKGGICFQNRP